MCIKKYLSKIFDILTSKYNFPENILMDERLKLEKLLSEIISEDNNYTDQWRDYHKNFIRLISSPQINYFLRTELIEETMFFDAPLVEYLSVLKNLKLYFPALRSNQVGQPRPYGFSPFTNGNTIHHLYSIQKIFNEHEDLEKYNKIIEFGGGYGNMAVCFDKIGFRGEYIIFDSGVMSVLQSLFIRASGMQNLSGVKYLNNQFDLANLIGQSDSKTLLIGTWSISESPESLRDQIFSNNKISCLIAFQREFEGIDNLKYFTSLLKIFKNSIILPINHLPNNYYFIKRD
jgi:hypothetical protein